MTNVQYCEDKLTNSYGHIEYYRPKNKSKKLVNRCDKSFSYFWLAYSWDNLLPVCEMCNIAKSNCFDILDKRAKYDNEELKDLHNKINYYNDIEKPKLLHPECDKFEEKILFSINGKILSKNNRVKYTVKICALNRNDLLILRVTIINDIINLLHKLLNKFEEILKITNSAIISIFDILFDELQKNSNIKESFSLLNLFIFNHFEKFLERIELKYHDIEFGKKIILKAYSDYVKKS